LLRVNGGADRAIGERALVDFQTHIAIDDRDEIAPQTPGSAAVAAAHLQSVAKAAGGDDADLLFNDLRFDADGNEKPDFPLNKPDWRDASIVVAARNFGCGSSREAAVYALYDHGVRCVIAPSFGDIFSGNAVQNGLPTAIVTDAEAAEIMAALTKTPQLSVTVDLEQQTIVCGNNTYQFTIDPVRRMRLLNGWDDIALTESFRDRIAAFKAQDHNQRPWAILQSL
jgi:3-isopropylmalate/(R)-2-methylmalate dehydratase small subunit